MRAEIISIGTEILLADIQDTNSHYIAQRLPALGVDLYYMHQVGDNVERLGGLIRTALDRSDVVICTGGLGPTEDDITRDAIARAVGEEARVDPGGGGDAARVLLAARQRHAGAQHQAGDDHPLGHDPAQPARHGAGLVGGERRRHRRGDAGARRPR